MSTPIPALLAGVAAASIWGGMYVVSKVVLDVIPPFTLLSLRLLLGFAALALLLAFRGGFRLDRRQWLSALGVGFIGYGLSLGLQFLGTRLSTAINGALVTSATPALVLPFAALILKEPIRLGSILSLSLATIGVLWVIDIQQADFSSSLFLGNLCLLGAALTWALYSVLGSTVADPSRVVDTSAAFLLGGLPLTLPLGISEVLTQGLGPIDAGILGGVLFLGLISTAVAMFLWNWAFAHLPAQQASLTFFAQPLVGVFLGWLLLGEKPGLGFLIGAMLISAALLLAALKRPRPPRP